MRFEPFLTKRVFKHVETKKSHFRAIFEPLCGIFFQYQTAHFQISSKHQGIKKVNLL
jgi:hypothetical protein